MCRNVYLVMQDSQEVLTFDNAASLGIPSSSMMTGQLRLTMPYCQQSGLILWVTTKIAKKVQSQPLLATHLTLNLSPRQGTGRPPIRHHRPGLAQMQTAAHQIRCRSTWAGAPMMHTAPACHWCRVGVLQHRRTTSSAPC